MTESKAWDWNRNGAVELRWLEPSEECYAMAARWSSMGFDKLLDYGCGLGRHAVFFSKNGFSVSAFDLSQEATKALQKLADQESLQIQIKVADMLELPYETDSFDAIFAYHVISHTDSKGIIQVLKEIARILRPGGEIFLTLGSKEHRAFHSAGYPKIDENTVVKTDDGPENGIPHFFADQNDIITLLHDFEVLKIRHIDDCFHDGKSFDSKHYFILARLKEESDPV